ncbi:type II toxin-antitoxin system ParD family antitoxin (plasmid) [Roseomonas sp. CCTCC AB2023176]|uniref:type II toxin-antitoxin system ParD family antitoxin n=1 Tax=Roseomonas sp. CCTCC AB2023176 TaxID=3342640 RepID=UPI0035DE97D2
MSSTPTRNVSLTSELEAYLREQVASGYYSNASEVVRASLRLLIEHERKQGKKRTVKTTEAPADG